MERWTEVGLVAPRQTGFSEVDRKHMIPSNSSDTLCFQMVLIEL
jgi:hypothetical protein